MGEKSMMGVCDHPGCKDLSQCRPVVLVRSKDRPPQVKPRSDDVFHANYVGEDKYLIRYCVALEYCGHHMGTWNLSSWVDEACWSAIENQLRQSGFAPPDKDSLKVEWEPACDPHGLEVA